MVQSLSFRTLLFVIATILTYDVSLTHSLESVVTGKPHKSVQTLDRTNFEDAIHDPANGLWFLKFYGTYHMSSIPPPLHGTTYLLFVHISKIGPAMILS